MFLGARCTTVTLSLARARMRRSRSKSGGGSTTVAPSNAHDTTRSYRVYGTREPREQAILNEPPHFVSILGHQRRQSTPVLGTGFVEPLDPAQSLLEIRLGQVHLEAFARNERRGASGRCEDQLVSVSCGGPIQAVVGGAPRRYCQVDVERATLSRRADFRCSHRTAQVTSCQTMKARSRSSR